MEEKNMTHFLREEKLREHKSEISHYVMERIGWWLAARCSGCLEHHGNRERDGLRGADVQGLHLFQQRFNYFRHRHLVKQMHSGTSATTGRKPLRFCCSSFLPLLIFVKLLQQLEIL